MKALNAKQLAFLLKITEDEALRKIAYAVERDAGAVVPTGGEDKARKLRFNEDDYRKPASIEILSRHLGLPMLQQAVNDIEFNYLDRKATRGWLLTLHESAVQKKLQESEGRMDKVVGTVKAKIPSPLNTMLCPTIQETVKNIWRERYRNYPFVIVS